MKFWEAMKAIDEGKTVTPRSYHFPINRKTLNRECDAIAISYWDDQWEVCEDPVELLSFSEVVKRLKGGKRFKRSEWTIAYIGNYNGIFTHSSALLVEDFEANDWIEVKE